MSVQTSTACGSFRNLSMRFRRSCHWPLATGAKGLAFWRILEWSSSTSTWSPHASAFLPLIFTRDSTLLALGLSRSKAKT